MRNPLALILIGIAGMIFAGSYPSESTAQRRPKPFSHQTPEHRNGKYADCAICHKLPSPNWQVSRRDRLPPFPDITNFPNPHGARNAAVCISCHVRDVYTDGGVFCGTCHTVASMRATGGRGVLPFPVPSRPTQFTTLFPHNVHQDLIASNDRNSAYAPAHFIKASFTARDEPFVRQDDKARPSFYNCAICHETATKLPKFEPRKLSDSKSFGVLVADTFEAPIVPAFFKDSPDSHASCFNCHYQFKNLPLGKQSCAGCHELTKPFTDKDVIPRYSLKFNHDRDDHATKDCMSCHLRIAQNNDIRVMKDADVPIMACKQCHATQEEQRFKNILNIEVDARDASLAKNEQSIFQCTYCHTSAIGRFETPASHR
jgi:hypothetical protein